MLISLKKEEWFGNIKNDILGGLVTSIALIQKLSALPSSQELTPSLHYLLQLLQPLSHLSLVGVLLWFQLLQGQWLLLWSL